MKAGRLEMSTEMGFSRIMGIPWERDRMNRSHRGNGNENNLVAMGENGSDPYSHGNSFPETSVMSQK